MGPAKRWIKVVNTGSKWTASAQEDYRSISAQANEVIYVGQEYSRDCMMKRNYYLVDHSSILFSRLQWYLAQRYWIDRAVRSTTLSWNYYDWPDGAFPL